MASTPLHRAQAAVAARRFFIAQRTKLQIADEMNLSRFKVARLIDDAVRHGIIQFQIKEPDNLNTELGDAVRRKFSLKAALVVEGPELPAALLTQSLGTLAAHYLEETLSDGQVLGVAWGRTLAAAARALTSLPRVDVVQGAGSLADVDFSQNPVELVHSLANLSGGKAFPIYGPMWAKDAMLIERLKKEPTVATAIAMYSKIDVLVTGIGGWPSESGLAQGFPVAWRDAALANGVKADVCATLIDARGAPIPSSLDCQGLCISTEQLRRIPDVVGVGGGIEKTEGIRGVLRGSWITVLITDAGAARKLLD